MEKRGGVQSLRKKVIPTLVVLSLVVLTYLAIAAPLLAPISKGR